MSAPKQLKISELAPSTKGELSLVFQVHQVLERSQTDGKQTVTCRVVDESGIITAHFDQFATKFTEGSVFELKNFRCKVVDHHLRLQMIKTTVVAKHPLKMGFKDLENDLSAKFYVSATKQTENEKNQKQDHSTKNEENPTKVEGKKETGEQKAEEKPKKHNHKASKEKQGETKKEEKPTKQDSSNKDTRKQSEKIQQTKKEKKYVQKQESKANKKEQPKIETKVEKDPADKEQEKKPKYVPKCEEILLVDCPKFQQVEANFRIRINLKTIIKKENYFMCKVSDSSGSTYFEFQPNMAQILKDKAWYRLIGFRVFKDRDYGFIATQQKHSSYELLPASEQKIETRLLWR